MSLKQQRDAKAFNEMIDNAMFGANDTFFPLPEPQDYTMVFIEGNSKYNSKSEKDATNFVHKITAHNKGRTLNFV